MASFKASEEVMKCMVLVSITFSALCVMETCASGITSIEETVSIALSIGSTAAVLSAVPSARRAQTLIMPGTLPTHQTSDELLSSTSEAMANDISGSSISSSDKSMRHSGVTHSMTDDVISSGNSGISGGSSGVSHSSSQSNPTNTVRMGKMLDEQPRTRSSTHHHVSATGH